MDKIQQSLIADINNIFDREVCLYTEVQLVAGISTKQGFYMFVCQPEFAEDMKRKILDDDPRYWYKGSMKISELKDVRDEYPHLNIVGYILWDKDDYWEPEEFIV